MRLVNRKVNETTYYRWRVGDLPTEVVERLGWDDGAELVAEVKDGRLILKRAKQ